MKPLLRAGLIALALGLAAASGCRPGPPRTIRVTTVFDFGPAVGMNPNAVSYRWSYFAGSEVESLRIHFGPATSLPPNAAVNLLDGSGAQVQRLTASGAGWSASIPGNKLTLQIFAQPAGPPPRVTIDEMEYTLRRTPMLPEEPTLPAQAYSSSRLLGLNRACYGFMRGSPSGAASGTSGPMDFYVIDNLLGKPIDIVLVNLGFSVRGPQPTLDVFISFDTFLVGPENARHHLTATPSAAALLEFDSFPAQKLYLSVRASRAARYYVMVNHVPLKFPISYEFEGDQFWNRTAPGGTTYFDLVRRLANEASVRLYDATDGAMRFDTITIYKTERFWTVGDVYIHDQDGYRANANDWDIDIGRNNLEGTEGSTIVHEWGHYEFGLPDEYVDVSGQSIGLCPSSLMSNSVLGDFCWFGNHAPPGVPLPSVPVVDLSASLALTGPSMWDELFDLYASDPHNRPFSRKGATPDAERFPGLDLGPAMTWRIFD